MEINPKSWQQAFVLHRLVCCTAGLHPKAAWLCFTTGGVSATGFLSPKGLLAAEKQEIFLISSKEQQQQKRVGR